MAHSFKRFSTAFCRKTLTGELLIPASHSFDCLISVKMYLCILCVFAVLASSFPVNAASGPSTNLGERGGRSISDSSFFYYQDPHYPKDCQEVYEQCEEDTESGIYTVQPDGSPKHFEVYCNNTIDGGKWTVIQRRMDGGVDFYRDWAEYKKGFGLPNREFWLGNDNLAYLTAQKNYELRIDMNNVNGVPYFAKYDLFRISDEWSKYRLVDLGTYLSESTANYDSLANHRNMSFTTYDEDNDRWSSGNCASAEQKGRGAWWYSNCHYPNLNGLYFGCTSCYQSINWYNLPGSHHNIKYVEMKIRER